MMNLQVSVIITTYNRPAELFEAIKSVNNQTHSAYEIIVINDGKYFEEFDVIKSSEVIFHQNPKSLGANYSRNKGVEISQGDIIMFLDDDDTWEPTKIEAQLSVFLANEKVGLVYSGKLFVKASNREKVIKTSKPTLEGKIFKQMLFCNVIGSTSCVALRKDVFLAAGQFDESLMALQDYDLWLRCSRITQVKHDGKLNLRYTVHDLKDQVSKNVSARIDAIEKIKAKLSGELATLSYLERRRFEARFDYSIAKAMKLRQDGKYIYWLTKSMWKYPVVKRLNLILPTFIRQYVIKYG